MNLTAPEFEEKESRGAVVAEQKKINVSQAAKLTGQRWHSAKKPLDTMHLLDRVSKFSRDSNAHYVLRPNKDNGV